MKKLNAIAMTIKALLNNQTRLIEIPRKLKINKIRMN